MLAVEVIEWYNCPIATVFFNPGPPEEIKLMRRTVFMITGVLILMAGTALAEPPTLHGTAGDATATAPAPIQGGATELLQVGDYGPEFGIGCSNGAGTSGGPNDLALGVTATSMPATFYLQSVSYNLFTQISPNITNMQFATWDGGAAPGGTGNMTSVPFVQGFNTVALTPRLTVDNAVAGQFYMGLLQNQSNVGFRAGVDSSSGSAGTSFIRAPTCGAVAFLTLDSLGFPGNWVIRAVANEQFPVELMTFEVYDD